MRFILNNAAKVALALGAAFMLSAAPAQAQLKIGLRVAPIIAYGRVQDQTKSDLDNSQATGGSTSTDISHTGNSATLTFSGGVIFDYFFKSNYAFGTGLYYTVKRASVDAGPYGKVDWNMQMLQVPVTIKLYTNEIAPDFKLYFQLGGAFDFAIDQKLRHFEQVDGNVPEPDQKDAPLRPIDISLIFGTGVEYRIAESTTLFAGFSYNRGLVNLNNKKGLLNEDDHQTLSNGARQSTSAKDAYGIRVDVVALDLGVKF